MRSFLIIGLGRFGRLMGQALEQQNNEVLGVDIDEACVNESMKYITNVQIGNGASEAFIESLGVNNFDVCVVAIGNDFQGSLETTALLKENGARFILARANRDVHKKFLLLTGADEVVYSERETAERLAVCYGSEKIFDYIKLSDSYAIYEIATPDRWVGKTIVEKSVRQKYGLSILATRTGNQLDPLPGPDHVFSRSERLMVLGHERDVRRVTD